MIEQIRIRGLGVIEDAVLEPHPGFTAVTGETGAGKTLVLTGLGLLLGGRPDAVRGGGATEVEGRVRVPLDGPVAARVGEAGGDLDEDVLVLARTVGGDARSRAYAGGRSVPAAVLVELAEDLVAVHGQRDQHRLLRPSRQRAALDRFGGAEHAATYAAYRRAFEELREVEDMVASLVTRAEERRAEAELLRHGLAQVAAVAPEPGEDDRLRGEAEVLSHADGLLRAAALARAALSGEDAAYDGAADVGELLGSARAALEAERDHDPALAELADRAGELSVLAADLATDLAAYAASVDADPARLAAVEQRRSELGALTRRYGDTVDEVLAWAATSGERLAELDGDDDRLAGLQDRRRALGEDLAVAATALSRARQVAADRFADAVSAELADLAMPHARLEVALAPLPAPGPHGAEDVELRLAAHAGAAPVPLASGASGGELSRVMLALEVVFAGTDPVPTLVFDEVDAGVGGRAAVEVGRRLARLARTAQVLVVTHLPQVAAFADRQVVVEKADDGRVTTTGLRIVDGEERVRELARMLAGQESSDSAAAHARELLELAAGESPAARRRGTRTRRTG